MSALYRIQWGCSYFVQNIILLLLYHDFLNKLFNLLGLNFPSFNVYVSRTAAVAAAKLLQLCPTLCDTIGSSPPGSPVPGILQARSLEWVAISFSNAWKWKVKVKSLSRVWLLATPWDCSLPGSSVYGIFQARVLEWGAIAFSTVSSCCCC